MPKVINNINTMSHYVNMDAHIFNMSAAYIDANILSCEVNGLTQLTSHTLPFIGT